MDWEKVELLPVDEIEMENKRYTEKYEGVLSRVSDREGILTYSWQISGKTSMNQPSRKSKLRLKPIHQPSAVFQKYTISSDGEALPMTRRIPCSTTPSSQNLATF
jgi:hypothetical protein